MRTIAAIALLAVAATAFPAAGEEPTIVEAGTCETVRYSWHLRGGLSWIAGIAFPTAGTGVMRTWRAEDSNQISSQLQITAPGRGDYYRYETEFVTGDPLRTIMSFHGYAWGRKERTERTFFDYQKNLARRRKVSPPDPPQMRVKAIPDQPLQDILTGIYFLRERALEITDPIPGEIYSDGTLYKVIYRDAGTERARIAGAVEEVRCFDVSAAEGVENRWGGGLKICVTKDDRRIPARIIIRRGRLASLDLRLNSTSACDVGDGGIPSP